MFSKSFNSEKLNLYVLEITYNYGMSVSQFND